MPVRFIVSEYNLLWEALKLYEQHLLKASSGDGDEDGQILADEKLIKLIPADVAVKNLVLPLKRDGRVLTVAMADPTNFAVIDDLKFITRYDIQAVIAGEFTLRNAIEKNYESAEVQMSALLEEMEAEGVDDAEVVKEEEEVSAAALAAQANEELRAHGLIGGA